MINEKITIPQEIEDRVYSNFLKLPIKSKLIVYSKLVFGSSFKVCESDILGLNKKNVNDIFKSFIETIKEKNNGKNSKSPN